MTFQPNPIQLKHLIERGAHRYNKVLKFRQGGFTTLYSIDLLDEALWVPGTSCGIIAHEAKKLPEYFNIIKRAFVNLPDLLKPTTKTDTKHMYEFVSAFDGTPLDSSIYVATKLRGGTVQNLHITESAYIKDREELKSGSKQAVPLTGRISEETTANGFNEFYDEYQDALNNENPGEMDYKAFFYSWVEMPEYSIDGVLEDITPQEEEVRKIAKELYAIDVTDQQLLWRRWKMRELRRDNEGTGLTGDQLFKQEYPLTITEAFQSGAGNVFDSAKIDVTPSGIALSKEIATLGISSFDIPQGDIDKLLKHLAAVLAEECVIYELPIIGRSYTIGVDPSDGEGSDNGAIAVWRKPKDIGELKVKVAQFYGKRRPDDLAQIATDLAWLYNHAFVGVENNMLTCILELTKIYDNYYFTTKIDEKTKKKSKKIGWRTDGKTRNVMIDDFIKDFDEDNLLINSKRTLGEMKTFVKKDGGKREHANGKHDDMLFADFIAIQVMKFDTPKVRVFSNSPF